jgi:hypothetical protein
MGLALSVGILADLAENDPEMREVMQSEFDSINEVLRSRGLPAHNEPTDVEPWSDPVGVCGFPYSFVHYLRRYYAHRILFPNQIPPVRLPDEKASQDAILEKVSSRKHHLLWHSDCEGFYVPVDFPDVIEGSGVPGGMLGSSQRLLEELRLLAAPLGFRLNGNKIPDEQITELASVGDDEPPFFNERLAWAVFFDAARASVETRAAICFG